MAIKKAMGLAVFFMRGFFKSSELWREREREGTEGERKQRDRERGGGERRDEEDGRGGGSKPRACLARRSGGRQGDGPKALGRSAGGKGAAAQERGAGTPEGSGLSPGGRRGRAEGPGRRAGPGPAAARRSVGGLGVRYPTAFEDRRGARVALDGHDSELLERVTNEVLVEVRSDSKQK